MSPDPGPLMLVVDGNSLLHRAHHAMSGSDDRDAEGRPTWALRGLVTLIAAAAGRLTPDALLVGFDCTEHSVRQADYPGYKAQRPDKPQPLLAQLAAAPGLWPRPGSAWRWPPASRRTTCWPPARRWPGGTAGGPPW
jgi:DNA polymerase-1